MRQASLAPEITETALTLPRDFTKLLLVNNPHPPRPGPALQQPSRCCNPGLQPCGGCLAFPKEASGGTKALGPPHAPAHSRPRAARLPPGPWRLGRRRGRPRPRTRHMKPRPPHARPAAPRPRALRPEPLACAGARGRGGAGRLSPAPGAFLFFTLKPRLRSLLCTEVALGQPARSQQDQAPGAGAGAAGRRRLRSLRRARPGRPSLLGLESGRWRRRRPPGEVGRAGRAGRAVGVWARWAQGSRPWGPSGCPAAGHWGPGGEFLPGRVGAPPSLLPL